MTGFEFLFSFYGLLLGLAVANVATSFADMWRDRNATPVGVAPPLLGLFILLAAAEQWASFWGARDALTMEPWEMLTSMGMALPYIFVSQGMFPREQRGWASLEAYYLAHSRVLMAVLTIPPLVSLGYNLAFNPYGRALPAAEYIAYLAGDYGLRLVVPGALLVFRRLWVHRVGIAVLCALTLYELFA